MRKLGFVIPKYDLPNRPELRGDLTIVDTRENSLNRVVKLAQHVSRFGAMKPSMCYTNRTFFG